MEGHSAGSSVPLPSDRKRSRLEALERRHRPSLPPPSSPSVLKAREPPRKFFSALSKPSFGGRTDGTPDDRQASVYAKLSPLLCSNEVAAQLQLSVNEDTGEMVNFVIRDFIQENGKLNRNLDNVLDSKILDRVLLLDNPAGVSKAVERARKRAKESRGKRSKKHLSMSQHKSIGSFFLPLQYRKFELYLPMHEMWKEYAKQVVEETRQVLDTHFCIIKSFIHADREAETLQQQFGLVLPVHRGSMLEPVLLQLDLHGAFLAVVEAKVNNHVGLRGIMIRETANTLAIVLFSNKVKVIPKAGSVFMYRLKDMCVTLYGDSLFKCKGFAARKI